MSKETSEITKPDRTPTETLITCLEDFGRDEPVNVVVAYITKGGDICWTASTRDYAIMVGLLETAKHCILKRVGRNREEH